MLNNSPPKGGDTVTHGPSTLQGKCHLAILYVSECWECGVQGIEERIYNPAGAWLDWPFTREKISTIKPSRQHCIFSRRPKRM